MNTDNTKAMSTTPLTLLDIVLDVRQSILQILFQDNFIKATLKDASEYRKRRDEKHRTHTGRTECEVKTNQPNILLVNKQLFAEGLTLFYQVSRLHLIGGCRTCTWSDSWSKTHLDKFIGAACLRNVREVWVDTAARNQQDTQRLAQMLKVLPTVRIVRLKGRELEADVKSWRELSYSEIVEHFLQQKSYDEVWSFSKQHHEKQIVGGVDLIAKDPERKSVHEVSSTPCHDMRF